MVPELKDLHGKSLACHSISLAIGFFLLAFTQFRGMHTFEGINEAYKFAFHSNHSQNSRGTLTENFSQVTSFNFASLPASFG
jgi:hypothetical protein